MSNNIITAFNDHFMEFINDVQTVFPDDADILTAVNALKLVRKSNPKMIVKIWNKYIVEPYKQEIESGNLDFFMNKDYSNDVQTTGYSDQIMNSINRLRNPIKNMDEENKQKTMKYVQNLTTLAKLCNI
jgi:hypothetical protein